MEPSVRRVRVVCVARNAIKAQFLMSVASASTVKDARRKIQKLFAKVAQSQSQLVSLWTTDGFRLYDPHDIWPLVDQDTRIVASDKNSFPGDITQLKRAMDGGAASDGGSAEPRKKVKREPTDYHRFLHDALPKYKAAHPSASHQSAMAGVGAQWRQLQQGARAGAGAAGASAAAEERTDSSPERERDGGGQVPEDHAADSSADSSYDGSDSDSDSVELTPLYVLQQGGGSANAAAEERSDSSPERDGGEAIAESPELSSVNSLNSESDSESIDSALTQEY